MTSGHVLAILETTTVRLRAPGSAAQVVRQAGFIVGKRE